MKHEILILMVALSVAFGATTVAAADHATVEVDQEPGEPATVTVTDAENEPVANASVTVDPADEDQPEYEGTGEETTDENGTVELPEPEETVRVTVAATVDNETVSTNATLETAASLELAMVQDAGEPATVTVTADGEPVENATVEIETTDGNETYAGANGTYTTDENGTVELPAPEETVEVTLTATEGDRSVTASTTFEAATNLAIDVTQDGAGQDATVTVTADDDPAGNASVDVAVVDAENASYAGSGAYQTDENGTVELPAPEETVDVTVTASHDDVEETVTVTLEGPDAIDDQRFGQQLQQFKAMVDDVANRGSEIASWVVSNNPGNAPDHAGPDAANGSGDAGPPAHANGHGNETAEDDETDDTGSSGTGGGDSPGNSGTAGNSSNGGGNGNNNGNGN